MKPIDQTKFGSPEGNCFAACLASILEIPLEEFPVVSKTKQYWIDKFNRFLEPYGIFLLLIQGKYSDNEHYFPPDGLVCVASGMGPRGLQHSVVWYKNKVLHDPHPSREGLVERPVDYAFIIPYDPAAWGFYRVSVMLQEVLEKNPELKKKYGRIKHSTIENKEKMES